ncbi:uncharacterized protein E0L32_004691 [Thyridium curvatum]|uniref:Uncharacterized protein n=1 Tax=Thyridium curvatum TaxID=1093900 RepID=A0A507B5P6_9PEZI|nr:uncharacterized protein E0L32_004691 [Thyridium curvatum]TPX15133.1 hypothetical protein E0L32_004691 [Thyridium curvatum]
MGLGDSVAALLDTYSRCLELLKSSVTKSGGGVGSGDGRSDHSRLRRSIRSDRGQIHKTYSSRLSEAGSRFEKGDGRSRSALRRILEKLKAAIANFLSSRKGHGPVATLDYRSLMSLSNSSRAEAVRAMDQFSYRLSSTASKRSSSVASSSSRRPSKSTSQKRHSRSSSKSSSSLTKARPSKEGAGVLKRKSKSLEHLKKDSVTSSKAPIDVSKARQTTPTPKSHGKSQEAHRSSPSRETYHRISIVSIATDSTKLGEIPERKWRRRLEHDTSSDEYNVRPIYPLKPYQQPEPKRKGFFGLFKR